LVEQQTFNLWVLGSNPNALNIKLFMQKPPVNYQFGFQLPASPVMEGIINFHHDLFFFLTVVLFFVSYMLARCIMLFNKDVNKKPIVVVHAPALEII
jgi:heme/copper-type cytochrome/quinol oxidase subunit 2